MDRAALVRRAVVGRNEREARIAAGYMLSDNFQEKWLGLLRGTAYATTGFHLHLFKANVTVGTGTVIGDLTECDFAGYAPVTTDLTAFGTPATAAHVSSITAPAPEAFTSQETVTSQIAYGYYVTDGAGALAWAESFAAGESIGPSGVLSITPKLRLTTC